MDLVQAYRLLIADVYQLAGRSRATSDRFAAYHGQSVARWHALSVISEESHTVPAMAERLGLTRQSVQRVVNELESKGLVSFVDNPRHRRSPLVAMTEEGNRLNTRLFQRSSASRHRALLAAGVTVAELETAQHTIRRLLHAVGEIDPPG